MQVKSIIGLSPLCFPLTPIPDDLQQLFTEDEFKQVIQSVNDSKLERTRFYRLFYCGAGLLLLLLISTVVTWVQRQPIWWCIFSASVSSILFIIVLRDFRLWIRDRKTRRLLFSSLHLAFEHLEFNICQLHDSSISEYCECDKDCDIDHLVISRLPV